MKIKENQTKLIFSVLGMALAVPLIAVPASAANESNGGGLLVKAEDTVREEINATVGTDGQIVSGTGNGAIPGVELPPTPALLASYRCGPLSFDVTQALVDFSRANDVLQTQGKAAKVQDSWSHMWSYGSAGFGSGFQGTAEALPFIFRLNTGYTPAGSFPDESSKVFSASQNASTCSIEDFRQSPRDGLTVAYVKNSSSTYSEGRYLSEDGKLVYVESRVMNSEPDMARLVSPGGAYAKSDTRASTVNIKANGAKIITVDFTRTVDGYNQVEIVQKADGTGTVIYSLRGADGVPVRADRKLAPSYINFDGQGKIVSTVTKSGIVDRTAAEYNSRTGNSWDGSFSKMSDFDSKLPFAPTAP